MAGRYRGVECCNDGASGVIVCTVRSPYSIGICSTGTGKLVVESETGNEQTGGREEVWRRREEEKQI